MGIHAFRCEEIKKVVVKKTVVIVWWRSRVFFKNWSNRRIRQSNRRIIMEGQSYLRNKQNLAGEFCIAAGEFSDLKCQMNILEDSVFFHIGNSYLGVFRY